MSLPKKDFSNLKTLAQMGDFVIVEKLIPDIVADGIVFFTGRDGKGASHVAMYVGGGERKIIEANAGGVEVRKLDRWCKKEYKLTLRRIKGITVMQAARMKDYGYSLVKKKTPYDYISYVGYIFLFGLRKLFGWKVKHLDNPTEDPNGLDCGNACEKMAKVCLDLFPDIGEGMVVPQDFLESDKLETIKVV